MSKEAIAAFLSEMRNLHEDEIQAIPLPEGIQDYVESRIHEGDSETLLFMLRLGYLMGLQNGVAAARAGQESPGATTPWGPIEA